jgi:sugar lactone lactonase YvrE
VRPVLIALSLAVAALVAGCGGGGGAAPAPGPGPGTGGDPGGGVVIVPEPLPLMVDSLGRQVPEADFGAGDPAAAGADGTAFDAGPMANAQVTLTDASGTTRSASTDSTGYYRVSIKGLTPPFIAKAKRSDGTEWLSASTAPLKTRGFVAINLSALTDKVLGYVAEGAAGAVTPLTLAANPGALVSARARLNAGLAAPLTNAGIDPAAYDPVSSALAANGADPHVLLLSRLTLYRTAQGRTAVMATVAGGATAALARPEGVAVDAAGNLLVADAGAHVVRRISPAGVVTTFGTGEPGFANGPASAAAFNFPAEVAADSAGNIFVGDLGNNAIRKIDANGFVSTLVDKKSSVYPTALAADGAGGVYFVSQYIGVFKAAADGTVTPVANLPRGNATGVALDAAGNLYVAFSDLRRIVRITPAGTMSDVYAPGDRQGPSPGQMAIDAAGTLYALDYHFNRVWRITPAGPSVLAGRQEPGSTDGPAPVVTFGTLGAIAVDAAGNVLVADVENNAIRKITPAGTTSTVVGKFPGNRDGGGAVARFSDPFAVAVDRDGSIVVADSGNNAIRRISPTGVVSTVAGNGTGGFSDGSGAAARFNNPKGVAVDANGNIYVGDTGNNAVRRIGTAGDVLTIAGTGEAGARDGNAGMATFKAPTQLAVDPRGDIYLSESLSARVRRITREGFVSTLGSTALTAPVGGIVTNSSGTVFFNAGYAQSLFEFRTLAIYSIGPDGTPAPWTPKTSGTIFGLGIDGQGNFYHHRYAGPSHLVRLGPAMVETDLFRDPVFEYAPIAVDRNGNIVVSDARNAAIRIVLP